MDNHCRDTRVVVDSVDVMSRRLPSFASYPTVEGWAACGESHVCSLYAPTFGYGIELQGGLAWQTRCDLVPEVSK
jgi:hypothetical protein